MIGPLTELDVLVEIGSARYGECACLFGAKVPVTDRSTLGRGGNLGIDTDHEGLRTDVVAGRPESRWMAGPLRRPRSILT